MMVRVSGLPWKLLSGYHEKNMNTNESNMNKEYILKEIADSIKIKNAVLTNDLIIDQTLALSAKCIDSLKAGGKIIFCGNGGSFADAQHLSAEFTSRFLFDRPGLSSLALGTNNSAITAIANDYGYKKIFSRELESISNLGDIFIPITTSGNSENILEAVVEAKKKQLHTVVLTGQGNGKLPAGIETINIPSTDTARIQECHILLGHIICGLVEESLFKSYKP